MQRNIMTVSFAALCLAARGTTDKDAALAGQVRAALARELGPALDGLTVEVRNAVVTLGGRLVDARTRDQAERTTLGVNGVAGVSLASVGIG
jgi:osmotically-inducible protein OsmY